MKNDFIEISELIVFANHGVFEAEKVLGQKFILSLELSLDFIIQGSKYLYFLFESIGIINSTSSSL